MDQPTATTPESDTDAATEDLSVMLGEGVETVLADMNSDAETQTHKLPDVARHAEDARRMIANGAELAKRATDALEKTVQDAHAAEERHQKEAAEHRTRIADLERRLQDSEDSSRLNLERSRKALQDAERAAREELERAEKHHAEVAAQIEAEAKARIEAVEDENNAYLRRLRTEHSEQIKRETTRADTLGDQLDRTDRELADRIKANDDLLTRLDQAQDTIQRLEQALETVTAEVDSHLEDMRSTDARLEQIVQNSSRMSDMETPDSLDQSLRAIEDLPPLEELPHSPALASLDALDRVMEAPDLDGSDTPILDAEDLLRQVRDAANGEYREAS